MTPYLLYEDVAGALAWLGRAFGFEERLRVATDGGPVTHAEMDVGTDGRIMLGHPGADYRSPNATGVTSVLVCVLVYVLVDDVDGHHARARAAGADVLREPADEDYGHRRYDVKDVEGHLWSFAQPLRGVPPEDWGAQTPS